MGDVILVADDEALFRRSVAEAIRRRLPQAEVLTAASGDEAAALLDSHVVGFLITDLRMPGLNGLELLASLSRRERWVPAALVTAHGNPALRSTALRGGALAMFEKPVDLHALVECVERSVGSELQAGLRGISLPGFVQLVSMEGISCTLRACRPATGRCGFLEFERGQLTHARLEDATGDDAARKLLAWTDAAVDMVAGASDTRTVTFPVTELLMQAAQYQDEGAPLSVGPESTPHLPPTDSPGATPRSRPSPPMNERSPNATVRQAAEKQKNMSDIQTSLDEIMNMSGAIATALVDYESGLTMGTAGGGPDFNIELAAGGNTQVVRAKMDVMKHLGIEGGIEDILITLADQYHLIRPMKKAPNLFLYVAIKKNGGNLGLARQILKNVEERLET